jgi:hypothetical protein
MSSIKQGLKFIFITNCTNFFNMIFAICVTKYLDKETLALYSIVTSVALSLGSFYQIIYYLISKHITKHQMEKDFDLNNTLNTIFNFSLLTAIIITILSYIIINYFYNNIETNFYIYLYIFLTSFFLCATNSQLGILNGKELHNTYSSFVFFTSVLRLGSLIIFIFFLSNNFAPFFSNIFANIALFLLLLFSLKINFFFVKIEIFLENTKKLYESFRKEKRIIFFNIILLFIFYSDVFFYSIDRSPEQISSYTVHSIFGKILYFAIIPLSIFLFPRFSKMKITFTIKNLLSLILIVISLNILFYLSIKFFFEMFYTNYVFNKVQFILLSIAFSCLSLFQISGEYLSTRYVNKKYIYIITLIATIYVTLNIFNNVYFVEIFCFNLILLLFVNILFYYKSDIL